jgi:hypothetical protein
VTIDFNKAVQTRDGRPVTILTTGARGKFSVVGYVGDSDDITTWRSTGEFNGVVNHYLDLLNVPERRVRYLLVWPDGKFALAHSRERADKDYDDLDKLIARVRVEYTEGQYDE